MPNKNTLDNFRAKYVEVFNKNLDGLSSTLKMFLEDIEKALNMARTTVQLNVAVAALIWALILAGAALALSMFAVFN